MCGGFFIPVFIPTTAMITATDTTAEATAAPSTVATAAPAQPDPTVTLQTPILRGTQVIDVITLRKPRTGALRGINLAELLHMRTEAVAMLLPRITTPSLLKHEVDNLDPVDLIAMASEVIGFLVPTALLAAQESLNA